MYNYGDLHMTYVKVEITDQDVERVETLARKRDAKKVKFGAGRHGNLTDSSEQSHSYGLFGELAVAKYFNIELDNEIYDDHGDAGYDFIIAGLKADVKTATNGAAYYEPWLKVPTQTDKDKAKLEKADIFIACFYHFERNVVYIQGWADKELVKSKEPERIRNRRTGKWGPWNHMVRKKEFKNIRDLLLTDKK